jgi:molybdenum cofactor cytidylyltransferase
MHAQAGGDRSLIMIQDRPTGRRYHAIVLAGGSGSRFGGGKLLAPYRGGELIDGALRTAFTSPVSRVIVVTGFDGERVAESVTAFAQKQGFAVALQLVHAKDYAEGMGATLRAGVAALSPEIDGAFVFLGDMPGIPSDVPHELADAIGDQSAAAPVFKGVRGHPVLLARRLFPMLSSLKGDVGARAVLDGLAADIALMDVADDGVLFDVDRWSDLAR